MDTAPSREELEEYVRQGLKSSEISAAYERLTGQKIPPSTIRMRIGRFGLRDSVRPDPDSVIRPEWRPIANEHRGSWYYKRLTQLDHLRMGLHLKSDPEEDRLERESLARWCANLREQDGVIRYIKGTKSGFFRWKRRPGDDEYTGPTEDWMREEGRTDPGENFQIGA